MKKLIAIVLLFVSVAAQADAESKAGIVRDFVANYNAGDVTAMLELTTEDVQWLAISDDQISLEAAGREALGGALQQFFAGDSAPRSELLEVTVAGPKVITIEQAFWQSESGEHSQCSVAVYELRDLKVSRVWYFDAYEC